MLFFCPCESIGGNLWFQTPEAPVEGSNPPASPGITIKDEPIDEGYDAALVPQSSTKQIKEELDQQEVDMKVYLNQIK